tara:strand:+ start:350 stop:1036 length:687 start_codon:yes stop_codon:yes gene_type:complete
MEVITIKQPAGIGDIFYCLKIAKRLLLDNKTKKVIWPVSPVYSYIKDYIKFPNLEFVSSENFNFFNGDLTINIQDADVGKSQYSFNMMKAKYDLVGLSDEDWLDYFSFERNHKREEKLFSNLNPSNEEYILKSENVGSPPQFNKHHIDVSSDKKIINVEISSEYNLFDWCKILENASEIYMVDTSFMYIMEKLDLKGNKFELYSRYRPANFNVVKHIPNKVKWNYNEW